MKKIVQFIIVLSSMLLIVGCAAQKKMLPQEIIEVKMDIEILGEDIMPIVTVVQRLEPRQSRGLANTGALLIPPIAFCGFFALIAII